MTGSTFAPLRPRQLLGVLAAHPKRWLLPAALVTTVVAVYAVFRPHTWEASQALIVRNEAVTGTDSPGKFRQPEEMKTVQETILELARSRGVLLAVLKELGPPAGTSAGDAWPTDRDVAELRNAIKLSPPKGAEFGKTEIFYLKVAAPDRNRALDLAEILTRHLEASFQQLRDAKAQSMIDELVKTVNLANEDLKEATARLAKTETEVGSDLAELRILHDSTAGESALRRTMTEIRNELRQARAERATYEELRTLLVEAQKDPSRLLAAPSRLLESQPALRRLKEGLVEAALHRANLQGRMSADHPLVRGAVEAERQIHENVNQELPVALRGIEAELRLNADRLALLEGQLQNVTQRLDHLATLRAPYSNEVAETQTRKVLLQRAQDKLAEAHAAQATANTASLITRIDRPDTGADPLGPSRAMLMLLGLVSGVLTGLGVLLLSLAQTEPSLSPAEPICLPIPSPPNGNANGKANGKVNGKASLAPTPDPLSLAEALHRLNPTGTSRW